MNGRTNSAGGALVSDMEIPLDPCTDFVGVRIKDLEYLGKVRLTWTDPKDKYATPEGEAMEDTDQLVSKWSYTQIVRQADRAPVNPSDGVTVCTETTRNQYQLTGFVDTTAESNVTYYYGAYAFNEDGVYSEVISNGVQPVSFSTTLADNTWEEIDQACTLGLAESLWEIGDTKDMAFNYNYGPSPGTYTITAYLIGFNHDILSDNSGTATMTFFTPGLEYYTCRYGEDQRDGSDYPESYIYSKLASETLSYIDNSLQTRILSVQKQYSRTYGDNIFAGGLQYTHTTTAKLWLFNAAEWGLTITESLHNDGTIYPYFTTASNKYLSSYIWTRTVHYCPNYSDDHAWAIDANYDNSNTFTERVDSSFTVVFGFCIGKVAV